MTINSITHTDHSQKDDLEAIINRFEQAKRQRGNWESLWQEAYDYTLPQRGDFYFKPNAGQDRTQGLFDATAMDAVDQLASSLLGNLTPTWSQWFGLKPGQELSGDEAAKLAPVVEKAGRVMQEHFDRSNFAMEIHQCFLDLVTGGTACLYFQEAPPGEFSAFRFTSVPLNQVVLDEAENGYLDHTFRITELPLSHILEKFPFAAVPPRLLKKAVAEPGAKFEILETVSPADLKYHYKSCLIETGNDPVLLQHGTFDQSPFINFRWMKSPGEIYGRSPVMKALPDIKTANKVVELILKNASIAVTGIWQADDDGVLNPANIDLAPGSIIPKAVGSKGLQALEMPGKFDISQLILDSLQARIRHALLVDRLGPVIGARMTATEVLERSAEISLILGATYGRLQTELLTPLVKRAFSILKRRGEIPNIELDGRFVAIDYRSPLARLQGQKNVQNTLSWVNAVLAMGKEASAIINLPETARFLGDALGVPSHLIRDEMENPLQVVTSLIQNAENKTQLQKQ